MTTTVVLADCQPLIRGGLHELLSTVDGITVVAGEATTGQQVVQMVLRHRPDVLIIDPNLEPATAIATITDAAPHTSVLVVTTSDDDATVRAAVGAGARGYLVKGTEDAGIVHVIHSIAAGDAIFGPSIASRIATLLTASPWLANPPFDQLTAREREILDLLSTGMSNAAIAGRLRLAPKTIRNNLSSIFGKLDVADRDEAIAHTRDWWPSARSALAG